MMFGKQSKFFYIKLTVNIIGLAVMAVPWIAGMPVTSYPVFIASGGGFVIIARAAIMLIEGRASTSLGSRAASSHDDDKNTE